MRRADHRTGLLLPAVSAVGQALNRPAMKLPLCGWPRHAAINVTAWMGLPMLAMRWMLAGERALVACTMPVWTPLLAWPVLGERPTPGWRCGH